MATGVSRVQTSVVSRASPFYYGSGQTAEHGAVEAMFSQAPETPDVAVCILVGGDMMKGAGRLCARPAGF